MKEIEKRIIDLLSDFKICPNCGKKFTKEEYEKDHLAWGNQKQVNGWWKRKKYCSYDCSNKYNQKTMYENQMKFTAPIEIWTVEKQQITEIKVKLYGKDIIFRRV